MVNRLGNLVFTYLKHFQMAGTLQETDLVILISYQSRQTVEWHIDFTDCQIRHECSTVARVSNQSKEPENHEDDSRRGSLERQLAA